MKTISKRNGEQTETIQCYCQQHDRKENKHYVVVANPPGLSSIRCSLRCCLQSLGRAVYPSPTHPLSLLQSLCSSSSANASVVVIDPSGPSSIPRRLRRCRQSLGRVVYYLSSANVSVVVTESAGPSYSANTAAAVVNTLIPQTHWHLRHWRRSLGRVASSASSIYASVVVLETSGSSSSAEVSVVVANSSCPSSRHSSLRCCTQISDPSDTQSIHFPPPTPLSSSPLSIRWASQ